MIIERHDGMGFSGDWSSQQMNVAQKFLKILGRVEIIKSRTRYECSHAANIMICETTSTIIISSMVRRFPKKIID